MTKRVGARQLILAVLLPGATLFLPGVCHADFIFHAENYTYLHEEDLGIWNRLQSGDFNGDLCPDFVMGSWVSNTEGYLEVFLGNSDGTFQALDHVITKEIWAWAVGDFDNNGFDDVLIKDYDNYTYSDTAMCYLSIGNGEFASPVSVPGFLWQVGGSWPNHMDINDFNMDDNLDLALAAVDSIEVYLGSGNGLFSGSWLVYQFGVLRSICSGDLNGDGKPDLIGLGGGFFNVYSGNGDGTFGEPVYYNVDGPTGDGDVCCGDFDEDGWQDIGIAAGEGVGSNSLFIYLNEGDGTFPASGPSAEYYWGGHRFFDIFFEDLDLDGHLDLGLAGGGGTEEAIILSGIGDGTFETSQPLWWVQGFGETEYARADFDLDGDPDIAVARKDSSAQYPPGIYVILNETIQDGIEGGEPVPGMLSLHSSANPFSSSITITCEGEALPGQLMVYDITGRLIRSLYDRQDSSFLWDGCDGSGDEVPTGTYLIQGAVDGQASSIRVVRL